MGLFKLLFGSNKTNSNKRNNSTNVLPKNYAELLRKTEELQKENQKWEFEFNKLTALRQKAIEFEKKGQNNDALEFYHKSIELGESSTKLNINNFSHDIERVIIIYSKTKNYELLIPFLQRVIEKYPNFQEIKKWQIRLAKLENKNTIIDSALSPIDIEPQKPSNPTLGKKLDDFRKEMPEFNFYYNLPEGTETLQYQNNVNFNLFKEHRELKDPFLSLNENGKLYEKKNELKKAIEIYEKIIAEEFIMPDPHERLIIIYSKLKWKEKEILAIKRAISTFENLKDTQKKYVLSLADKYGMTEKALEYINSDKKIFYYGGAFELYNPQKARIEKWNKRLKKLEQ